MTTPQGRFQWDDPLLLKTSLVELGTHDVHALILGRAITGISASAN